MHGDGSVPRLKRPSQRPGRPELSDVQRRALASRVRYVGSAEHKIDGWWGGMPAARQLRGGRVGRPGKQATTVCPLTTKEDRDRATEWLRIAIREGRYRFVESDQDFPKHVWHRDEGGQDWFGMCINTKSGAYKGWPIDEEERRAIRD